MTTFTDNGDLWEADAFISSLGSVLKIYMIKEGSSPTSRQMETLDAFNRLQPAALRNAIANAARQYCQRIDSIVGLADEGIEIDLRNIAKFYRFKSLLIPEVRQSDGDFVFISADCDWETEHGMQILTENGEILFCGDHSTLPYSSQWIKIISAPAADRKAMVEKILAGY